MKRKFKLLLALNASSIFVLTPLLTACVNNANREAINEELKRLNANNFDFNYPNKNQTYALDAKAEQFTTNSNDQIELVEPKIIERVNQEAKVTLQYRLKKFKKLI